ncbi:hypothetical protein Cgig2_013657 [Carnegiea gigantea]|uniref:Uncharacterized protein n=1 Tax=Carnegiea gigantea TaxID=171969 RepID=A0A9Q1Q825_9CARY|nr:hypothetical protein Cgig2_013657 [Carnegiea gigantea]
MELTNEKEVLEFEEKNDLKAKQIVFCLIGKLHTKNSFNIRAMNSTFKNVWKLARSIPSLANSTGKCVSADEENLFGADKYYMAGMDIDKRLSRGINRKIYGKLFWFDIRHTFATLGKLGHIYKGCKLYNENSPQEALTYSPKLRASLIKSIRRGWQIKKLEKKWLIHAFWESRKSGKARCL